MYKLYIANKNYSSWSLRPWLLMAEMGIPFDEQLVPFQSGSNWDSFRDFCPTGTVPCLQDGELTVWDSLAIVEYLAERHQGVWPNDNLARAWARCASAEMHSGFATLRQRCTMNCGLRIQLCEVPASLQRDIDRVDELWNEGLSRFGGPFLAGQQFSAVDAFFAPVVFRIQTFALALGEAASEYVTTMLELESMRAWQEAGLKEAWRDPDHELEAQQSGKITADFRSA